MKKSYALLLPILLSSHALAEKQYVLEEETTIIRGEQAPLQWTPHAVTVIKDEEIGVTYRHDLEDLQGLAPGLIVDSLSGTPQGAAISIRGVGTSDVNNGFFEPGVAVKVDGVYVGTHASQMQVLFDFEQVEVARGPQGTLEGSPNLGGTIHLKRRKPTGSFGVDFRTSFGENNRKEFDVAVNFPITKSIAGKVTHTAKRNGGDYINNVTVDRRENEEDRSASSVALLATFRDNLTVHYIYDTEDDDSDTPALLNISTSSDQLCIQSGTSEETCGFAEEVPQTQSKVLTAQNFSNERHYEGEYHTLNLNFDFEGYEVSSITGSRETEELSNIDWDASHVDFYSATREQTYKQFSQEVTLRKQHNEKLAYSFGFYYLDFDYTLFQEEFHVLRALHNAGLACCFSADDILRTNSTQSGDLQSAFVHGTYQINEQWIADAGLRFSKFDKTLSHQPRGWRYGDIILESKRNFSGRQTTKETTPTLGLSYKVDDEAMIYLRYSTGYLPGAYDENALSLDTAQPTEAQTAESWELGMNSEWLEDKLRLNMTYFQIDYDNKIEEVPLLRSTGQIELFRKNLSNYEVTGYEIEFQYIPMTNFMIRGNYTHMNANYHDFLVDNLDVPEEPFDFRGLDPHRSPRESLYLSFEYSKNYFYGTFNAFAGYRLYSDYQTNSRLPVANIFNWTSWDLSLDYVWRDWTIRVFAQNVKDKQHLQNVRTITQADVLAQDVVTNDLAPLITYAEYSQPRYGGVEIIFEPDVKALFKKPNFAALKPTFLSKVPLINKIPLISK